MREKYGFVYILCNASMPGIYKVGITSRSPAWRAHELSGGTGVAKPFEVMYFIETKYPYWIETNVHQMFEKFRVSENREFFNADPLMLQIAIQELSGHTFSEWESPDFQFIRFKDHRTESELTNDFGKVISL